MIISDNLTEILIIMRVDIETDKIICRNLKKDDK